MPPFATAKKSSPSWVNRNSSHWCPLARIELSSESAKGQFSEIRSRSSSTSSTPNSWKRYSLTSFLSADMTAVALLRVSTVAHRNLDESSDGGVAKSHNISKPIGALDVPHRATRRTAARAPARNVTVAFRRGRDELLV